MKKKILSIFLIIIIFFTSIAFSYKKAEAVAFEGLLGVAAAHPVVAGICAGMVLGGVVFTSKTIYENSDSLQDACQTVADGYISYIKGKFKGQVETVTGAAEIGQAFLQRLYDGVLDSSTEAFTYWKEYLSELVKEHYDIFDYTGTIYSGTLDNFPVYKSWNTYYDALPDLQHHPQSLIKKTGEFYLSVRDGQQIISKNLKLVTLNFLDRTVPVALYLSKNLNSLLSLGPLVENNYRGNYAGYDHNTIYSRAGDFFVHGYVGFSQKVFDSITFYEGSDYVFQVKDTYENFKTYINYTGNDEALSASLVNGLAHQIYNIDNWGTTTWDSNKDINIEDYPVKSPGVNSVDSLEGIPNNVSDAIDNNQAWDVVPNHAIDNWGTTADVPQEIPFDTDMSSLGLPGVRTIEDAIAYAQAHDLPLSVVLEAMGLDVGDVSKDISYTKTFEATMTDDIANDFAQTQEKVSPNKQIVKPIIPTASSVPGGEYTIPGLDELFPFCVPFDVYRIIQFFNAKPKAPKLKWNVPSLKNGKVVKNEVVIDFSDYDDVATIFRTMEFLAFALGFVLIVRNLIKG